MDNSFKYGVLLYNCCFQLYILRIIQQHLRPESVGRRFTRSGLWNSLHYDQLAFPASEGFPWKFLDKRLPDGSFSIPNSMWIIGPSQFFCRSLFVLHNDYDAFNLKCHIFLVDLLKTVIFLGVPNAVQSHSIAAGGNFTTEWRVYCCVWPKRFYVWIASRWQGTPIVLYFSANESTFINVIYLFKEYSKSHSVFIFIHSVI